MRKLISSIHLTLDGFCDHTAAIVDEQLNQAAIRMLRNSGTLLLGSVTFRWFEGFWPVILGKGVPFAVGVDKRVNLQLIERESLDSGVTGLAFRHNN